MQSPEDIRQALATRFARQHRRWFVMRQRAGAPVDAAWPLALTLGRPTEQDLVAKPAQVREWVALWERFDVPPSGVRLEWAERQWPRLGRQRVPERLVLASAEDVAQLVGHSKRWQRACDRSDRLTRAWPALSGQAVLGRVFDALAHWTDDDFDRLVALLTWVGTHPGSGLYLRQLPVNGLDTKWIASRSAVVTELLRSLRAVNADPGDAADLHALLGLRRAEARIRVRLLCPTLRHAVGGLEDLELPVEQLARLGIQPHTVLIVENLETGLALPDLPGVVVVMKLGAAVRLVAGLPWVGAARCLYWGDIDTFGFEILNRARSVLPQLQSVLMDVKTLLDHQSLCVPEPTQSNPTVLPLLTAPEAEVYEGLHSGRWGTRLRLEQERVPWAVALEHLRATLTATPAPKS